MCLCAETSTPKQSISMPNPNTQQSQWLSSLSSSVLDFYCFLLVIRNIFAPICIIMSPYLFPFALPTVFHAQLNHFSQSARHRAAISCLCFHYTHAFSATAAALPHHAQNCYHHPKTSGFSEQTEDGQEETGTGSGRQGGANFAARCHHRARAHAPTRAALCFSHGSLLRLLPFRPTCPLPTPISIYHHHPSQHHPLYSACLPFSFLGTFWDWFATPHTYPSRLAFYLCESTSRRALRHSEPQALEQWEHVFFLHYIACSTFAPSSSSVPLPYLLLTAGGGGGSRRKEGRNFTITGVYAFPVTDNTTVFRE